jgi:hypothetical protein
MTIPFSCIVEITTTQPGIGLQPINQCAIAVHIRVGVVSAAGRYRPTLEDHIWSFRVSVMKRSVLTSIGRSTCRKPPLLNKLLSELIPNSTVTTDGVHPRATWQGNPNIAKWGLTWREMDDGYIEIGCSIFMKGVMLPGHGNVLEVLAVGGNVDVLICLHPLGGVEGMVNPTTSRCAYRGTGAVR